MSSMTDKLVTLGPELTLLMGACVCMLVGLSASSGYRRAPVWVAGASLLVAAWLVWSNPFQVSAARISGDGNTQLDMVAYVKLAILGVGVLLLLLAAQLPDALRQNRDAQTHAQEGNGFDRTNAMRGEFFAFFLFSLTGAMLCAAADDLVWLFLSLELTSLPTYVMVATTRDRADAQEAAVKYFFLGAMSAAVFLYGFAMIYGATGATNYDEIRSFMSVANHGLSVSPLFMTGMVLAVVGVSFKIAAVPMHFYTADVYQGAAAPVTAFLAFVPKTAGFVSLVGLLGLTNGLSAPQLQPLLWLLWVMAAATMTVGNVLGLLQDNVKRVLAYSSVAHSGYMLVGLVTAMTPANGSTGSPAHLGNGIAGVLFYLVAYGLATLAAFAVLGCLSTRQQETQTFEDIAGLGRRYPALGAIMLLSVLSLVGLPPMVGFVGKIYLFGSAIEHGHIALVIIAVINSAISAVYYLRIASACYFSPPSEETRAQYLPARYVGGAVAAVGALVLGVAGNRLVDAARDAAPTLTVRAPATAWRPNLTDTSPLP